MYNDSRGVAEAESIEQVAPPLSPARGTGSSLAKLLVLKRRLRPGPGTLAFHQMDWLLGYLTGRYGVSDWNNCLKLGFDARTLRWPQWLSRLGLEPVGLPRAVAPGTGLGRVSERRGGASDGPAGVHHGPGRYHQQNRRCGRRRGPDPRRCRDLPRQYPGTQDHRTGSDRRAPIRRLQP